ncbi:Domain of unknown function DUF5047 [uncultured Caudovirales phage]|uniref:DUF5047 domain-containing protein n=1 Tax=uncultured Caudovirales phage TaxID=2100421 RepID=A0A6J5NMK4_9CAUD|nr:Domain of unknown function DUF5047 [uncultured Caudovirales phage]
MYPVTDAFLSSVRKSHISKIKVEIYDVANGEIISYASPTAGSVTIDSRRTIRRQCNLEFVDTDGTLVPRNNRSSVFLPYNREIKIYRGVQYFDGTEELVPLGVFQITTVEVTDTAQGIKINVEGSDRSLRIQKAKWTSHNFSIDADTPKELAIKQILQDRYPNVKTDFPATGQVCPITYPTLDQSSDPWKEALKISESAGMDLYFDANGVARMRPIPDPDLGQPLIEYTDGADSVLTQLGRNLSTDESYNHVIYTGEGTNLTIGVIGEAKDENPSSPTYVNTYGSVPIFKSSPNILTVAEAEEAARAELKKVIGASEKISWDQIVNPAHDVYDLIKIVRNPSGVSATLMIDTITIPLDPKATMNAIGRTRRF